MKFELGQVVTTRGVYDLMAKNPSFQNFVNKSLARHIGCDWGDLDEEDKHSNDLSVKNGDDMILSKYTLDNTSIYIITEWDRSATTILFPSEY